MAISRRSKPDYSSIVLVSGYCGQTRFLEHLGYPIRQVPIDVDETRLAGEQPKDHVLRISENMARSAFEQYPRALVIGSYQSAVCLSPEGHDSGMKTIGSVPESLLRKSIYEKPGTSSRARAFLSDFSGRSVTIYTAACVIGMQWDVEVFFGAGDKSELHFRELNDKEIRHYVEIDNPVDRVGCLKLESYGASLLREAEFTDFSLPFGLPLISLTDSLRKLGIIGSD
ncbi:MAG TPA: Maf family protein [Xanthomonadales bacterium]|nr:Maf family protein [Xanthomonadales bacterium]